LVVVVEVALARLTALRAVKSVLSSALVLATGHVFFIDGEAAAQDAAESTLAFSVPDGGAGTSVLNLTECC
jgi:hypothetical protein